MALASNLSTHGTTAMTSATTTKVANCKGYEIVTISCARKTLSCKARLPSIGVSPELSSLAAAKDWIKRRETLPMHRRAPLMNDS